MPAGRELRDRDRAGAADDQVGFGVAPRHVVDEGDQLAFDACAARSSSCSASRCFSPAWCTTAGLFRQQRQRLGQRLVQRLRAEAAADHEDAQRPAAAREALLRRRAARAMSRAHRIAGPLARPCSASGKRHHDLVARLPASTRLVSPAMAFCSCSASGRFEQRGHHAAGKGDVAAQAEHHIGPDAPKIAARALPERRSAGSPAAAASAAAPCRAPRGADPGRL